jgi:hypothetical protein
MKTIKDRGTVVLAALEKNVHEIRDKQSIR